MPAEMVPFQCAYVPIGTGARGNGADPTGASANWVRFIELYRRLGATGCHEVPNQKNGAEYVRNGCLRCQLIKNATSVC